MALVFGLAYLLIGRLFPQPAESLRAWRLAAWVASAAVFAVHIGYEHFVERHAPRVIAWHAALAVAIGAFGLAVAGMMHSLATGSAVRTAWLLALIAWPLITAVPAFLAALAAGAVLARLTPAARSR